MNEALPRLLLRLSEAGEPAILWGRQAAPYAGRSFDRLLDRGVLIEQAPATEWDVCSACECGLVARPIQRIAGRLVASCPIDKCSDVVLDDDDLRSFRIDSPALVREIAIASGFGDEASPVAAGVWHLGETSSQRAVFLALTREAVLQPGMIGLMRAVARSLPITMISPVMTAKELTRFADASILGLSSADCFGGVGDAAGLAIDPATLECAPAFDAQLIILRQSQRVIIGGIEKHIPQQPFKLLVMLAEALGGRKGYLAPQQIEAENSGRDAADLVRELRKVLGGNGKQLIKTRRSPTGYFLALTPGAFELRP